MSESTPPFHVELDEEHAVKLRAVASRMHVNPGTLASSLLSIALDQADPDPASITALLDSIPGALARANQGLHEGHAGKGIRLAELLP